MEDMAREVKTRQQKVASSGNTGVKLTLKARSGIKHMLKSVVDSITVCSCRTEVRLTTRFTHSAVTKITRIPPYPSRSSAMSLASTVGKELVRTCGTHLRKRTVAT